MHNIYSTGQVARLIGVRAYQIEYAHSSGKLAEPSFRFLGKRVYTGDDLLRVARHFGATFGEEQIGEARGEAS